MTQSGNSTREGTGDAGRLPSVVPAEVQLAQAREEKLAVANEFFSSIDADQIIVPQQTSAVSMAESANEVVVDAELDTSLEDDFDEAIVEELGSELQQALPQPVITKKAKSATAIPMAKRASKLGILIKERDDEPFRWRELLTWKGIKRNSSFLVSLLLHTLLLLFLSLLVVRNGIGDSKLFLDLAEAPAGPDEAMLDAIDINPVVFDEDVADIEDAPLNELFEDVLEKEDSEKDAVKLDDFATASVPISGDASNTRRATGDGKSATFFGTKASGRRFVFVVDRSTSMEYGSKNMVSRELFNRYDVAKSELLNAIESLQPHQEFFVVMFAHDTLPMFGSKSIEDGGDQDFKLISATRENKARFQQWLEGVRMTHGTDPRSAVEIAIELQPDAVFMLSDGAFLISRNDPRPTTRQIIQQFSSTGLMVPINTISLVVEETIPVMKSIAEKSGGSFKFTTINDYIKQVANLRGPMRSRALEQLIASADGGWEERREIIVERLLPMLNENSAAERLSGESLLQRATMGLFGKHIDPILKSGGDATQQWHDIVKELDGYYRTQQVTALGQGRELEQKILLAMLELEDDSFLQLLEKLDMDRVSSLTMIELIHGIGRSHVEFGTSAESIGWLRYFIAKLGGKKPKERSQLGKIGWDVSQARVAMNRLFESRRKRAQEMYRKYKDPEKAFNIRERFGNALVSKYPETKEAGRVRLELQQEQAIDSPVSIEGMTAEELFGQ
jgi:hypothetical protein